MNKNLFNLISKILIGQQTRKKFILHKQTKMCLKLLNLLWDENLILGYSPLYENSNFIKIFLKYLLYKIPSINNIKIFSKSNKNIYLSLSNIWKLKYLNINYVISTSKGLLSLKNCKKFKLGGKLLLIIK